MKTKLVLMGLIAAVAVQAGNDGEKHYCVAPTKPAEFASQMDVDNFSVGVNAYQSCIKAYVTAQEERMKVIKENAETAIAEFNLFVKKINEGIDAKNNKVTSEN